MNSIAAMLGNMQSESTINPGIWESLTSDPNAYYAAHGRNPGFGLTQWTPYTKYTNWCNSNNLKPEEMDSALKRIEWELENGEQFYPTTQYPETFKEFKESEKPPSYLAMAFLHNYERPEVLNQPIRGEQADYWYSFISSGDFVPMNFSELKKKKFNFILFGNKQWR